MSDEMPAYGPYSKPESIVVYARSHPYEYIQMLRQSQAATCQRECCVSEFDEALEALEVLEVHSAATQKELSARLDAALRGPNTFHWQRLDSLT